MQTSKEYRVPNNLFFYSKSVFAFSYNPIVWSWRYSYLEIHETPHKFNEPVKLIPSARVYRVLESQEALHNQSIEKW